LQLWADTVLCFRLRYSSTGDATNGFWTHFEVTQESISGAGGSNAVEVASWTVGDKRLYITVNGTRRMKIDVTNLRLHYLRGDQTRDPETSRRSEPAWRRFWSTGLQVWDAPTGEWVTPVSVMSNGDLRLAVDWRQRATQAEVET